MKLLFQGLRFGMLLQLAIGPLCLLVFETGATQGFFTALPAVCAIALVDALYIALSLLGVSALLQNARVRTAVKWMGCSVLVLFGANAVLGALDISLLPSVSLFSYTQGRGVFIKALLLTASNPLTILFWGGVLSARAAEHGFTRGGLMLFAAVLRVRHAVVFDGGGRAGRLWRADFCRRSYCERLTLALVWR